MSITPKAVLDAARKLTPDEREQLLELLLAEEEVDERPISQEEWDAAWGEEAERRWKEHVASGHPGYPAEEVLSELAAELKKRRDAK